MHGHTCRDCGADIRCNGTEAWNGCTKWNGSNDGCECALHDREMCREGYRCEDCYDAY